VGRWHRPLCLHRRAITLLAGGLLLVVDTVRGLLRGDFAADIVASLAISGALVTDDYLAGCVSTMTQPASGSRTAHWRTRGATCGR
jgi:hypothetical protein